jgi:hypothetical protein
MQTDNDIPVLAVIPKAMVIEFGSEIISGKTNFEDAITILQTSHENASVVGQAAIAFSAIHPYG